MYNYYTPQLGSFSSLVKKAASIADPRNAFSQAKRTISTGVEITKDAGKLAVDSTKRAITNPTGIVDNVIEDVKQAAGVTAKAVTKPVTDEITNVKKDFYSGGAYQSAQREAAAKAAAKKREEEAMIKHMQEVREANAKNANEASRSAGEASKQTAAYKAAQAQKQHYREVAEANAKNANEASRSAGVASASNAVETAYRIENADSQGTQQIRDSAAMAQNSAATSEQMQYLPEVQVKSDFSKYLLIGGGVLLLAYILKGQGGKK